MRRWGLATACNLFASRPCPRIFATAQAAWTFLRLHFRRLFLAFRAQAVGWLRIVALRPANRLQLGMAIPHPRSVTTFLGTRKCLILKFLEYRVAFFAHLFRTWTLAACQLLYHFFPRHANHVLASTNTAFYLRLRKKVSQIAKITSQNAHS